MEYYKELYFNKTKHSYALNYINFRESAMENTVKYDNIPTKGIKLFSSSFLDPKTGYLFQPTNGWQFKEMIIRRNLLVNGVCIEPVIFEYTKDELYNIHLYNDVKHELQEIKVKEAISLSETKPGTLIRNMSNESYYIYMGLVGQYYVSTTGEGVIKKKHLVLKTDYINQNESNTLLRASHFTYLDYKKDTEKNYFKILDIAPENMKISYYSYRHNVISLGDYIENEKFKVYDFQRDYPSLMLSKTIRKVISSDDLSLKKNIMRLEYEYLGTSGLELVSNLTFTKCDDVHKILYDLEIKRSIRSTTNIDLDFEKNNYAIEYNGKKYLIYPRILPEIGNYQPNFQNPVDVLDGTGYVETIAFYKLHNAGTEINTFYNGYKALVCNEDVKIFKVSYNLNNTVKFNLFENPFKHMTISSLKVTSVDKFETYKTDKIQISKILGADK